MYEMANEEIQAIEKVIRSGKLFRYLDHANSECKRFEENWSHFIGVDYTIGINSGTSALISGLVGLDIQPGDEIILPAYTFVASLLAILAVDAVPVLVNIDESLTMDVADLERALTPRTRAIMPVYMRGFPCRMDAITALAVKHGLAVIEDVCQASGGEFNGKRLGSFGDVGCFSFNHFKLISCGEGGAITTSIRNVYERAFIYHDSACAAFRQNTERLNTPIFPGQNYRMMEISAAILNEQSKRLERILTTLRHIKKEFISEMRDISCKLIMSHDAEGDCGTTIGLYYETQQAAEKAALQLQANGFEVVTAFYTGQHVFSNWGELLSRCATYQTIHRQSNCQEAFESMQSDLTPTLDTLKRTLLILPLLSWDSCKIHQTIKLCQI